MSIREYPFYYQGALLTPDVFDAGLLLALIATKYEIELSDNSREALENGQLSEELESAFCKQFFMERDSFETLDDLKVELLTYNSEVFETIEEHLQKVDGLKYHHLSEFEGDFFYERITTTESMTDAHILAFDTPLAWHTEKATHPRDLEEAIIWLNKAGKLFFSESIDWENKLGELLGTELC